MKVAVITAIFGGIDTVKDMPTQTMPFNRIVYTGDMLPAVPGRDNREKALYYKTQSLEVLPDYDIIVWLDGKVQVESFDFLQQCVDQLGSYDLGVMKHLYRKCIYEEVDHIEHCIKHGNKYLIDRYARKPIRRQVERYRKAGYPVNAGLFDCCIYIARNTEIVRKVFANWYWDVKTHNHFDQTALPYHAWFEGLPIVPLVFKPGSFKDIPHIK